MLTLTQGSISLDRGEISASLLANINGASLYAGPGTTIRQQQSGEIYYADSGGPVYTPGRPDGTVSAVGLVSLIADRSRRKPV